MLIEFSVAGFRFGHSMIRPSYAGVRGSGIKVPGRFDPIGTLAEMIDYAGLQK